MGDTACVIMSREHALLKCEFWWDLLPSFTAKEPKYNLVK